MCIRDRQVGLQIWAEALEPGLTEAQAAAAAEGAIHSLIGQNSIRMARAWAMVQSGPNTVDAGRFNRSSGRRIEEGDLVLIEICLLYTSRSGRLRNASECSAYSTG